ncbi:MAG: apolipoprotein N-acyltransferase [Pseudomonadota bacterium]|nr:apolipoprotein N-acyltransferase [Pseudomonadota bacterium]
MTYYKEISALIVGGLLAFAFAPLGIYPLAIFSPALLFLLWLNSSAQRAFILGLLFGIGFYGVGVSWVFISIHEFGHTSLFLASLITGLFIFILALFTAIQGFLVNRFYPSNTLMKLYLIFPSSWALTEWVRSWIFTGFPWLLLGTSQVNTPLSGYAPLFGVYGLTFLVALTASLFLTVFCPLLNKYFNCQLDLKNFHYYRPLFAVLGLWVLGYLLHFISWTHIQGKPIQISLVQANIPQEIKWEPAYQKASLIHYQQLTQAHWNSRLIIWPEAAIPLLQNQAEPFLKQLDRQAKQHKTTLIAGIPIQKGFQYYNGMLALGLDHATYYKQRLVIFGEYLPWWILWAHGLLNLLDIPMSSFSPGPNNQPIFRVANVNLGTFICYEIAYSHLVRQALKKNAQLLLTINDDAWFGHSFALAQHLQIGQFQALATGRYLAFLSNTGLTAIVTPKGKIIAKLPPFETGVLTSSVYKSVGFTPWVYLGDGSIIIFLVGLSLLCYAYRKDQT